MDRDKDPRDEEKRVLATEQRKRANSFAAVAEAFIQDKLGEVAKEVNGETITSYRERKGREVAQTIRRDLIPRWSGRAVVDISANDVRGLIREARVRAPYQAHNLLGHTRRIFSWAIDQGDYGLEHSPVNRLKPKVLIGEKRARKRVLSDDEIRAFWRAVSRLRYPYRHCSCCWASAIARSLTLGGLSFTLS